MICCIVAFAMIARFVLGWNNILEVLGLARAKPAPKYDYHVYCELDAYDT